MKTYKTKASANRAAKNLMGKYPEIISFEAEEITGLWSINVIVNLVAYNEAILKVVNGLEVDAPKEDKKDAPKKKRVYENSSSAPSPCSLVWDIAEEMGVDAKRKDVLAACEKAGVTFYTARTQYQKYKEALRGIVK